MGEFAQSCCTEAGILPTLLNSQAHVSPVYTVPPHIPVSCYRRVQRAVAGFGQMERAWREPLVVILNRQVGPGAWEEQKARTQAGAPLPQLPVPVLPMALGFFSPTFWKPKGVGILLSRLFRGGDSFIVILILKAPHMQR